MEYDMLKRKNKTEGKERKKGIIFLR